MQTALDELKEQNQILRDQVRSTVGDSVKSEAARAEETNACQEAINMLRDSHRALMANDARTREELQELKLRYRHDAHAWERNFRELQEYYQGVKDAPPPATAETIMGPRHDDDEPLRDDVLQDLAMKAAWGGRDSEPLEKSMRVEAAASDTVARESRSLHTSPARSHRLAAGRAVRSSSHSPARARRNLLDPDKFVGDAGAFGAAGNLRSFATVDVDADADDRAMEQLQWSAAVAKARHELEERE